MQRRFNKNKATLRLTRNERKVPTGAKPLPARLAPANLLRPIRFLANATTPAKRHLVDFQFYAPGAKSVKVVIGLSGSLIREFSSDHLGGGAWTLRLLLTPGRYEYHFLVDGEWRPDPLAPQFLGHAADKNSTITVE